jgi:hypothetical protein
MQGAGAAEPTGPLDALQPLLGSGVLGWADRRALRQDCRSARLAIDAAVRSLDLRRSAGGFAARERLPELRRFLERLRGLRELQVDGDRAVEVLGRVGLVEGAGERLRWVIVSFTAAPCSIGPSLSMLLRAACPNLEVSQSVGHWMSGKGLRVAVLLVLVSGPSPRTPPIHPRHLPAHARSRNPPPQPAFAGAHFQGACDGPRLF